MSFPAAIASTAASPDTSYAVTAPMARSSVMITPSNPSSSRKMRCTSGESDAGRSGSMQVTVLWLTKTASAPAAMPAAKGKKSSCSNCS